jgi:hypothetical protein
LFKRLRAGKIASIRRGQYDEHRSPHGDRLAVTYSLCCHATRSNEHISIRCPPGDFDPLRGRANGNAWLFAKLHDAPIYEPPPGIARSAGRQTGDGRKKAI